MPRKQKYICAALGLICLGIGLPFSPLNRRQYYVDLHTGRIRSVRYLAFVKLDDTIQETDFSKLWKQYFGDYPEPDWQIFARFLGMSGHSTPDYQLTWRIDGWELALETAFTRLDGSVKGDVIRSYIRFLERRDPVGAEYYVNDVSEFVRDFAGEITPTNAPSWLVNPEIPYVEKSGRKNK